MNPFRSRHCRAVAADFVLVGEVPHCDLAYRHPDPLHNATLVSGHTVRWSTSLEGEVLALIVYWGLPVPRRYA